MKELRPTIVVLDGHTLNPGDLSWKKLEMLGPTTVYDHTPPDLIVSRAANADVVLTNKAVLDRTVLEKLPGLGFIAVTATGYNNIDLATAKTREIPVANVVGYAANSVAQHVFALMLAFTNQIDRHHRSVVDGQWAASRDFCYTLQPIRELSAKTIGIYGFGQIGQKVADIAEGFGMKILSTHKHPERDRRPAVRFVSLDVLFSESDFITLHAPLTAENERIVNRQLLARMKPEAYLVNTGRGGLIDETDLAEALRQNQLAGAALDVLTQEPPPQEHPLIGLDNCIITPHQAWASRESRQRLLDATVENIKAFIDGQPINVVNW